MGNQVIYGYRTITRLLKKRDNLVINPKKVYRIMKENGWFCRVLPKKGPSLGKPYYVTENKLDRDFKAEKPLEKLVTDMTYLYFGNCKNSTFPLSWTSIIVRLWLIPSQIVRIRTLCWILWTNWMCLKERSCTAIRALSTPQKHITRLAQKEALSALCPVREHQQIMPVSNGFILS